LLEGALSLEDSSLIEDELGSSFSLELLEDSMHPAKFTDKMDSMATDNIVPLENLFIIAPSGRKIDKRFRNLSFPRTFIYDYFLLSVKNELLRSKVRGIHP